MGVLLRRCRASLFLNPEVENRGEHLHYLLFHLKVVKSIRKISLVFKKPETGGFLSKIFRILKYRIFGKAACAAKSLVRQPVAQSSLTAIVPLGFAAREAKKPH